MIKIKSISIGLSESRWIERKDHTNWTDANWAITRAASHAPKDGSYDKTDIILEWEDGFKYEARFDLQYRHAMQSNQIGTHVKGTALFYSGIQYPAWMDPQKYAACLSGVPTAFKEMYKELLEKYDLGE